MTGPRWRMPETTTKADGSPRQVGVEFELQGLELTELAELVAETLSGELTPLSKAEYKVVTEDYGNFIIEADFALLKDMARAEAENTESGNESVVGNFTVDMLSAASSVIVPCEVVAPPIPMTELPDPMHALTTDIRKAGGQGTRHSPFFAFGLHLNVEPVDTDASTVVAYMKSFVCLFDWLAHTGEVDLARRATPYIQRYPGEYDELISDPDYWPGWDDLINDYLRWNASRNRAMDMLPMFMEIDKSAVKSAVDDDLIKPRPAFHYRLANCAIDEPDWSVEQPWNRWLSIEALAMDRDKLNECCAAYREDRDRLLHRMDDKWRKSVTRWID